MRLQRSRLMQVRIETISLDSTIVKVHPDGTGTPKKTAPNPLDAAEAVGVPKCIWLPRMRPMSSPGAWQQAKPAMRQRHRQLPVGAD